MKLRKVFAFVLALCMALSISSFASAEDAIKIGIIGPLTGGAAMYGNAVANGAAIAVEEVNALGGIQLQLLVEDDENATDISVGAYNAVMENGAQAIIGTVTTSPCIEVGSYAFDERVFMLTPSASSPKVIEGRDNVYQVCFTDPAQGAASAEYIFNHKIGTKVGIIYNNGSDYSVGIYQTFTAKAQELGLEIVATSTFPSDDNVDFSVQIAECQKAGADVVFLPIYCTPASLLLKQADAVAYKPVFFGVDGMDGILSIEGFDPTLAEGVMLLTPFSADAQDDLTVNFVTKYQAAHGEIPNQFAADAYDAVYAMYAALTNGGVTPGMSYEETCEILIAEMQKIEITGLTGTMTWSATGEVSKTPTAVKIENGIYVGLQ